MKTPLWVQAGFIFLVGCCAVGVMEFERHGCVRELAVLDARIQASGSDLIERERTRLEASREAEQELARGAALAAEKVRLESQLANRSLAGNRWNAPPVNWPAWQAESPYVWIHKNDLLALPISTGEIDRTGALSDDLRQVLALEPEAMDRLNARLRGVVDRLHAAETARARWVDNAPDSNTGLFSRQRTLKLDPDPALAAALRSEYLGILDQELGAERSKLSQGVAGNWLTQTFESLEGESKTISVSWLPDGAEQVVVRSASTYQSASGPGMMANFVPAHLQRFFKDEKKAP